MEKAKQAQAYELNYIFWALRTIEKSIIDKTSFLLIYGVDTLIPVKIRAKSFDIQQFKEGKNEELMRTKLDFLEEIRELAKVRSDEYKRRAIQYHNVKVKPRQFKKRDLVLKKIEAIGKAEVMGKLRSNWKGSFKVTMVLQ